MYLIVIAWAYVALMMGIAEANHPNGTLLGAAFTVLLYGVGPVALLVYFMGRPARRAAREKREAAAAAASQASAEPDRSGEPSANAVPPVGKEP